MPYTSLYVEEMVNDPELAEEEIRREAERRKANAPSPKVGPRPSEYTNEVARLDLVVELLQAVNGSLMRLGGEKAPRIREQPRPVTAIAQARDRARWTKHNELVDEVNQARARRAAAS
ncbi:hypothetical protein AB0K08_13540 [Citricoccus sp. NPDC055426]|uniref:hypothetical protein n=1 Tax=Citricoccus sp. NPDC055426 TaxID=3155536 RepID=UPI00342885C1